MKRDEMLRRRWDVIVVGTGMGGATLGYSLARAGHSVLFCEKGRATLGNPDAIRAHYPEEELARPGVAGPEHHELLARAGRWSESIYDTNAARSFVPFIGCGTGGSSALSGMAMERLFPSDFMPRDGHRTVDGSTLPDAWPVDYDQMAPHYQAAEHLYGVRGTVDPLRTGDRAQYDSPVALSAGGEQLFELLRQRGTHPYRLPVAHDDHADCPGCQGFLSPNGCKRDSAHVCLTPAVTDHDCHILTDCDVLRVEAKNRQVSGVVANLRGRSEFIQARTVVMAAGALATPTILLRSQSAACPDGLANSSGLVGRNLMRHYVDLFAVDVDPGASAARKELALNDFYQVDDVKLGTVQSFGALPPASLLAAEVAEEMPGGLRAVMRRIQPLTAAAIRHSLAGRTVLASIAEDLPYLDNAVSLARDGDRDRVELSYRLFDEGRERVAEFRRQTLELLAPVSPRLLKQAENNHRIAHVCGTCRFGDDPKSSVLDRNNRAHDLDNLYVVDASFFPSSGGTNPSLTIAANALRVGQHLAQAL